MDEFTKHGLSFVKEVEKINSKDFKVAEELIESLFCEMAKLCTKYSKNNFYEPYTYRERQLDSVLLPALSIICDSMVFAEYPARRQCSNRRFHVDEHSGRIDYWCIYKDYSFVIELKHSYDCFATPRTRKDKVTSRWIKMNEQLQSIEKEIKDYDDGTKGVVRIGLHIVTSYSDKHPDNNLIEKFRDSVIPTFDRFQKDLSKPYYSLKPNLIICWTIPEKIVLNSAQTFPGLWAIVKIYPCD